MDNMSFEHILSTLRGRWRLGLYTFVLVVGVVIVVTAMMQKKYTATASILIDFHGPDPVSGTILPGQPGYLATQLDVISSRNVALKVVDALAIDKAPEVQRRFMEETEGQGPIRDWAADLLLRDLRLDPARESSVVNITYTSPDPHYSAAVANAFAQGYIRTNVELRVDPAKETSAWFDDQLKTLKANLESAQQRLSEYQQKHGIVATDERIDAENARLQELSSQLVLAQAQTYDSLSKQRQISEAVQRGGSNAAPDVLSNPVIQGLKGQIAQVQAHLSELSSNVGTNHPQYQSTQEQLQSLNQQLQNEMHTIAAGVSNVSTLAQQREGSLRAAMDAQKAKILAMRKERDGMMVLLREANSAQAVYDGAMQRYSQTRLESRLSQSNVALVSPAIAPIHPSRPRWLLNMVLAATLGINGALGFVLMREMSDRRIRAASDLLEVIPAPLLGELVPVALPRTRLALPRRRARQIAFRSA